MDWMDDLDNEIKRIRDKMKTAFDGKVSTLSENVSSNREAILNFTQPTMHKAETEKSYMLSFELPGVQKGDISIAVQGHHLELNVISQQSAHKTTDETESQSFSSQEFHKVVRLPRHVSTEGVRAKYREGILSLVFPKKETQNITIE